jgi:hypothetical protein
MVDPGGARAKRERASTPCSLDVSDNRRAAVDSDDEKSFDP